MSSCMFILFVSLSISAVLGQSNYEEDLLEVFNSDYVFRDLDVDSTGTAVGRDGKRVYYVYYQKNGTRMRAEYNYRFVWTLTYVYIPFQNLPEDLQEHVLSQYVDRGYRIVDVRFQDAPGDSYFKVDVIGEGQYLQLRYMTDGKFMKAKVR